MRQSTCFIVILVMAPLTAGSATAADLFMDVATTASILRDVHVIGAGCQETSRARTNNGQSTAASSCQAGGGSTLWDNERNQVLAGIQYGRRAFDSPLALPGGIVLPQRLESAAVSLLYKRVTSNDWSISHSVRFNHAWTNDPAISVKDTIDLVGLAAVSYEPGIAWAFGYIFDQTDGAKDIFYPVLEYINTAHERWSITAGFPIISGAYSPHPDLILAGGVSGGATISYKVTELNIVRLTLGGDGWAYRLKGPGEKAVSYAARRVGLDWSHPFFINHHTVLAVNAGVGWEFSRRLGADDKMRLGDAAVGGAGIALSF